MIHNLYILFSVVLFAFTKTHFQNSNIDKIIQAYPYQKFVYKENSIFFQDGSSIMYDDRKKKKLIEKYNDPDIEDQFCFSYNRNSAIKNTDAGRIRNELFFKKMYGNSKEEVRKNLVEIVWCPVLVNQKIWVSKVNRVDSIFISLSSELDKHPEFKKYLQKPAGTFQWRKIAGTSRLSTHSFGITIDINLKYSNYWQWDCKCQDESIALTYGNNIPLKLVEIFEKHGFIWGGRWKHYDTMHFEYRPELLMGEK